MRITVSSYISYPTLSLIVASVSWVQIFFHLSLVNGVETSNGNIEVREVKRDEAKVSMDHIDHNSCPSAMSRERKWRSTFRAIFSSPSLIPAYVFGNSRRSGPRTTHTLYRTLPADGGAVEFVAATPGSTAAALAESSRETKNCGRGYPCTLQYSFSIRTSAPIGRTG